MPRLGLVALLLTLVPLFSTAAQELSEPDHKEQEAIRKVQRFLDEPLIDSASFGKDMPLDKFLEALEKHLPREPKLSLRIDREAFGNRLAEVAATAITLPASQRKVSLRTALERALAKSKIKLTYRLNPTEVIITTPARARYVAGYDIRSLVEKPDPALAVALENISGHPTMKAAQIVQTVVGSLGWGHGTLPGGEREAIQILNGTRLVIRATAAEHAQIDELLAALRRLDDLAVTVQARLYEVDEAFYTRLKNARRVPLEELEKQVLDGNPPGDDLFKLLAKQPLVQTGDAITVDTRREVGLLSRQQSVLCLPSPAQVARGDKGPQIVVEGVAFLGRVSVSADRRYVQIKLTEKSTTIQDIDKVKAPAWHLLEKQLEGADVQAAAKEAVSEVALLREATSTQSLEIPDGGSMLIPVNYRPAALQKKGRWWVLALSPRILIEDEVKEIRKSSLEAILPAVVKDVLTNPRLKATRDFVGTAGDGRFALVNSPTFTWPETYRPEIAGHQLTPGERKGKRLLGIRVDQAQEGDGWTLTIALVNAGGKDNGAVFGPSTLRYHARSMEKGWGVELADGQEP
jgi:hypothetical protein